ncbi:HET-domain-containing protein [Periconia macrospinosa]|uniref:HET-domain-containing protein n=1 Tax=Periconia macrospinosa TaxID=97972 RepID=A0A2V1DH16_9PLEO|nr:HET-domain-containing protein [Periconia macrospinosa]
MRLLSNSISGDLSLIDFTDDNTLKYAILSHTWRNDGDEVTFKDIVKKTGTQKPGYEKLRFCEKQAASDGIQFFWVDTHVSSSAQPDRRTTQLSNEARIYNHNTLSYCLSNSAYYHSSSVELYIQRLKTGIQIMNGRLYGDLDPTLHEIRLLHIEYSSSATAHIRCQLEVVKFSDNPQYEALSYVWGTDEPVNTIFINNEPFPVRQNLFSALKRLRSRSEPVKIWIDAICINQENTGERNHQVRQMGNIYSQAQRVIIWLGEEEQGGNFALQHIKRWNDSLWSEQLLDTMATEHELDMLFDPNAWRAMALLFNRPWWRRIWVIQEVALSRSARLQCGSESCDWNDFLRARTLWSSFSEPQRSDLINEEEHAMIHNCEYDISIVIAILQNKSLNPSEMGLLSLIRLLNRYEATDCRDKLYALLGIKQCVDIIVNPDYDTSPSQVYTEFVRAFLRDKKRLSVIGGGGIGHSRLEPSISLPSWVPDLRRLDMIDDYCLFSAAGDTEAAASISDDSMYLSANGVLCCDIDTILPRPENRDVILRSTWLRLALNQPQQCYPTGIPLLQAYFRTIIADSSRIGAGRTGFQATDETENFYDLVRSFLYLLGSTSTIPIPENSFTEDKLNEVEKFNDYVSGFARWRGDLPTNLSELDILEPFLGRQGSDSFLSLPPCTDNRRGFNSRFAFAYAVGNFCRKRSFFVTNDGHFGLAPPGTQKGDVICVLFGCEMPLIVRPMVDTYLLVGSCYIYGMMHGEMLERVDEGKLHISKIVFE